MQKRIAKLFDELGTNHYNSITFFREGRRYQKKFSDFSCDIDNVLQRLAFLSKKNNNIKTIAIIGPISYDWILCDMACIKGGFLSVAIPEALPTSEIEKILNRVHVDLILLDYRLKEKNDFTIHFNTYYIECNGHVDERNFSNISIPELFKIKQHNNILKEYSLVFSSGTSEKIKCIKKCFFDIEKKKTRWLPFNKMAQYVAYKKSFWSRKDNKLIIFMPFSHPQQRDFFRMALLQKINIVLSDSLNYQKHIILEKPNILVSVPVVYEMMANRIQKNIEQFSRIKERIFKLFNITRINRLSNRNPLKNFFTLYLFSDIKKIYGGRADYFVSGSAAISIQVLKVFYSIGVKILQAYGQTEIGNIALSSHKHFRIGSVGKPLVDIKIGDDFEILVKYNSKRHSFNKDILTINSDGYINTGDLGYLDGDNFLFITGRKDSVIVLETGKKIYPEKVENEIKKYDFIQDAFLFSPDGYSIYVVLDYRYRKNTEKDAQAKILQKINTSLLDFEKIEKYHIAKEPFSIDNGFLTLTFKKKRKSLQKYYSSKNFTNVY